jgi:tetratricopeptide (TPR) repeat protein
VGGYARRPAFGRYLGVLALTLLALLAKPMLVTLPALMLLVDLWPLRRLEGDAGAPRMTVRDLVLEKVPFLLLAGAAAGMTLLTAGERGALVTLSDNPLPTRVAHATVSYVWFAWKTAWPAGLGIFYPYPTWATWQVAGSAAILVGAAVLAAVTWRRARWVSIGLAWWAIALFPVSGLFQAGSQGMADRFTYLPSIGLLVAIAWTLDALARTPRTRAALGAGALVASAALAVASARQITYWKDGRTLYERTLAVTTGNWIIQAEVGNQLLGENQPERAYAHFEESYRLEPRFAKAAFGLGLAAKALGRPDEAEAHYRNTLRIEPTYVKAHTNLGILLFDNQHTDEALHHLSEAVRMEPDTPGAVTNLRYALEQLGVADVDGYVNALRRWSVAVAIDRERPAAPPRRRPHACAPGPARRYRPTCFEGTRPRCSTSTWPPALTALEHHALPPTTVGRCFGDEPAPRVPAPPFAPFRAQVAMQFGADAAARRTVLDLDRPRRRAPAGRDVTRRGRSERRRPRPPSYPYRSIVVVGLDGLGVLLANHLPA